VTAHEAEKLLANALPPGVDAQVSWGVILKTSGQCPAGRVGIKVVSSVIISRGCNVVSATAEDLGEALLKAYGDYRAHFGGGVSNQNGRFRDDGNGIDVRA
jgi:hypothetical protein